MADVGAGLSFPSSNNPAPKLTDISNVSHHASFMADGRWCSEEQLRAWLAR